MTAASDTPARRTALASGLQLFLHVDDDAAGGAIADEAYECAEIRFACGIAREGDVVIDAGAHVGCYALPLAAIVGARGHVHAFEPLQANVSLLARSIRANGYEDRLHVHRQALGLAAAAGVLRHGTAPRDTGHACLETLTDSPALSTDETRSAVDIVALDECVFERPVALLKLDIEGAEMLALRGASALLRQDRPVILIEIDYARLARVSGASPQDLFDYLETLAYAPHDIRFDGAMGDRLEYPPTARVSSVAFLPLPARF